MTDLSSLTTSRINVVKHINKSNLFMNENKKNITLKKPKVAVSLPNTLPIFVFANFSLKVVTLFGERLMEQICVLWHKLAKCIIYV